MNQGEASVLDDMQDVLGHFGGSITNVTCDPLRVNLYGNNDMCVDNPLSLNIRFNSPGDFIEFARTLKESIANEKQRTALLKKYPAAEEAWKHYKSIETLCSE